jgi:hypothetical protein
MSCLRDMAWHGMEWHSTRTVDLHHGVEKYRVITDAVPLRLHADDNLSRCFQTSSDVRSNERIPGRSKNPPA